MAPPDGPRLAPLLSVRGLRVSFPEGGKRANVVDDVSFDVNEGETLALVGESGSGKTVTALSLLGLLPRPAGRVESGQALFQGRDLLALRGAALRSVRGGEIAMIFQDPNTALNPVTAVGSQIAEAVRAHGKVSRKAARSHAVELLRRVRMPDPEVRARAYPHELSGGMKQRALIAMAIAGEPRLLIADEPTTALDATVQAQVLGLLRDLQSTLGMALLIITHDMGVVAELADRVAVLYAGRIVETGPAAAVFDRPLHPYTAGLFASLPRLHAPRQHLPVIPGDVPGPHALPLGCRFRGRCHLEAPACAERDPPLVEAGPARRSACPRALERAARGVALPAHADSPEALGRA